MIGNRSLALTLMACTALLLTACASEEEKQPQLQVAPEAPTVRLTLLPLGKISKDEKLSVQTKLTHLQDHFILYPEDMVAEHGQPFHLMITDSTLTDYHHVLPVPIEPKGLFNFDFTPNLSGGYRAWAAVTPVDTRFMEFARSDIGNPKGLHIDRTESRTSIINNYEFVLDFDQPLIEKQPTTARITITGSNGNPIDTLTPMYGHTLGHISGFHDDFRTVLHVYASETDPDTSTLTFRMTPQKEGFVKLFLQVRIAGKTYTSPFGITVAPRPVKDESLF